MFHSTSAARDDKKDERAVYCKMKTLECHMLLSDNAVDRVHAAIRRVNALLPVHYTRDEKESAD